MVNKLSSAKDLELDQMQLKAIEGDSMHACING